MTPAEFFSKAVKGTVLTIDLEFTNSGGKPKIMPGGEYDFIDILEINDKKVYVANQWQDEFNNEPLYLVEDLVKKVTIR